MVEVGAVLRGGDGLANDRRETLLRAGGAGGEKDGKEREHAGQQAQAGRRAAGSAGFSGGVRFHSVCSTVEMVVNVMVKRG